MIIPLFSAISEFFNRDIRLTPVCIDYLLKYKGFLAKFRYGSDLAIQIEYLLEIRRLILKIKRRYSIGGCGQINYGASKATFEAIRQVLALELGRMLGL